MQVPPPQSTRCTLQENVALKEGERSNGRSPLPTTTTTTTTTTSFRRRWWPPKDGGGGRRRRRRRVGTPINVGAQFFFLLHTLFGGREKALLAFFGTEPKKRERTKGGKVYPIAVRTTKTTTTEEMVRQFVKNVNVSLQQ